MTAAAASGPAPAWTRVAAQTRVELTLLFRRGEAMLVNVAIPVGMLVFFSMLDVLPHGGSRPIDFLAPGVLALSIIASAMTSLGIATSFERQQGVLKRLGATPLGRSGLLAAKIASTAIVVAGQAVAVSAVAYALGWRPDGSPAAAAAAAALGLVAFGAIGLVTAGTLRAEANLAVANGLFLVFLLVGGIVVPVSRLPAPLRAVARVLPAEPLATALRNALGGSAVGTRTWLTLGAWAVASVAAAVALFRWE